MFYDELKRVSIASIEEAIGRAISDLVGARFVCTMSHLDLSGIDSARMDISVSPPKEFGLDGDGGPG